jgi:predicted carbohydrate-binding protein with CBM5 and CBM33 domain
MLLPLLSLLLVAAVQLQLSSVDAHGHLHSPRSRNYVAFMDGREAGSVDAITDTTPLKEYDPNAARLGDSIGMWYN